MKRGERRSLRMQNMKRLRDLGLPTDLFSEGFWEREAEARRREKLLLEAFESLWMAGHWDHLLLPFEQILTRWKTEIASPRHFASIGPNPRWVPVVGDAVSEWRRHSTGSYKKAWRDYRRRRIIRMLAAKSYKPSD